MENSDARFEAMTKAQFKRWSKIYDRSPMVALYLDPVYKKIIETLESNAEIFLKPGSFFLDTACGTGEILFRIAPSHPETRFVGVDFSEDMLEKAKTKVKSMKNVNLVQANAEKLPFEDQAIAAALCSDSLHHFASAARALTEVARVLKKGGALLVVDPAFDTVLQKILVGTFGKLFETPKKYYSRIEIKSLLEDAGFRTETYHSYHFANFFIAIKN